MTVDDLPHMVLVDMLRRAQAETDPVERAERMENVACAAVGRVLVLEACPPEDRQRSAGAVAPLPVAPAPRPLGARASIADDSLFDECVSFALRQELQARLDVRPHGNVIPLSNRKAAPTPCPRLGA